MLLHIIIDKFVGRLGTRHICRGTLFLVYVSQVYGILAG